MWIAKPDPVVVGGEQAETRPVLVISVDSYNRSQARLVIVLPITTKDKEIPYHIPVGPREGGLREKSFIMCDQIKCISTRRLLDHWGSVNQDTMTKVEDMVRILLGL
ncbi:MAG: type II toxin-antitoxin system PemK/MazF family toxin [Actinomycetia bacterium]|nr:type II toxin-antitoxin system PemK/MazF family toxin [Actinomycetes bacterium]